MPALPFSWSLFLLAYFTPHLLLIFDTLSVCVCVWFRISLIVIFLCECVNVYFEIFVCVHMYIYIYVCCHLFVFVHVQFMFYSTLV